MVSVKGFVWKAEAHDQVAQGHFGAGKFHREMLELSKMDKVSITAASIKEVNPLGEVSLLIDTQITDKNHPFMEWDDNGSTLKLDEAMIAKEVCKVFAGKFINRKERFVVPLYDNKCMVVVSVENIAPINVKNYQSYGMIVATEGEEETDILCKARNPKQLKINSTRIKEKQVFKKDVNFQ